MGEYNNLKKIREIYGATQDEIAKVVGVNRSTISQWETSTTKASNTKLEKLSIFYGIGPENFYEKPDVEEKCREILVNTAKKALEIQRTEENRNKVDEFHMLFENTSFKEAMQKYMISMKLLLAMADNSELKDLKIACQINQKMGKRLEAIISIREEEEKEKKENSEETLFDLMDTFEKN